MSGIIVYSLFVFWVCGIVAVLIDFDHIFVLIGRKPRFKLSDSYGRPFHNRAVFALVAVVISLCMATSFDGFYRGILSGLGFGGTVLLLIGMIIITYIVVKKVGNNFGERLREQRRLWRVKHVQREG